MTLRGAVKQPIVHVADAETAVAEDYIAAEEPLEIQLAFDKDGKRRMHSVSITMRTPGDDFDLAAGFLYSEGIIRRPDQIVSIDYALSQTEVEQGNRVCVELPSGDRLDLKRLERHFYTTSSCGVCGKTSLEAVLTAGTATPIHDDFAVTREIILSLPAKLRSAQAVFDQTGGLHASALFSVAGELLSLREDVGRHNALDKLIGSELLAARLPLRKTILLVSGRSSFELVQKAVMARIPIMAAVGAPSSLAVQLAAEFNITLIGFLRDRRFNIYSNPERISAMAAVGGTV